MARRGNVLDACGVERGKPRGGANLAGEIEMRCGRRALDRDDARQRRVSFQVATDDIEKIHLAAARHAARDLHTFFARQAFRPVLVGDHADAHDELRPGAPADRIHHAKGETQPVIEAAAILIVALVGRRGPELVRQMAVGVKLDAIEAGFLHPRGGGTVIGNDPVDIPVFQLLRERPVGRFADRGRGQVPAASPPCSMRYDGRDE